jgi:predicted AlkP superfamily phosphohydrolase/phosphomutase
MMQEIDWSLLVMHTHAPDWAYHSFVKKLDPKTEHDAATRERFLKLDARMYQVLDALLARVVEGAGKDALVVVVSDHGVTTSEFGYPDIGKILDAAGLRAAKEDGGTDVAKSKVVLQRSCYIYVNCKGRDPGGIVEPQDYENVREAVIKALYDYTDPKTGIKPFSFVLKREEARVLGLYGDRVGDIVYALRAEYGGQHGNQLTTGETGVASMRGLLILSGPGVKKGVKLERNVWLTDVVPTVCHLTGLPIPADAEGGVVYQALEEPDGLWKRIAHLEQKCAKLEAALGAEQNLTHTYNK